MNARETVTISRNETVTTGAAVASLRARAWLHFTLVPVAGIGHRTLLSGARLSGSIALAALLLAYAYGLNAISDRRSDSVAKNSLRGCIDTPWLAVAFVTGAGLLAVMLGATLGSVAFAAALTSLVAATVYSLGPRMKAVPILGTTLNLAIFAPLLFLYGSPNTIVMVVFSAMLLQNQLVHEMADAEEDARAGVLTTARALGPRATNVVIVLLAVAGVAAGALASLVLAMCTIAALAGKTSAAERRVRHRWVALIGGAIVYAFTLRLQS